MLIPFFWLQFLIHWFLVWYIVLVAVLIRNKWIQFCHCSFWVCYSSSSYLFFLSKIPIPVWPCFLPECSWHEIFPQEHGHLHIPACLFRLLGSPIWIFGLKMRGKDVQMKLLIKSLQTAVQKVKVFEIWPIINS